MNTTKIFAFVDDKPIPPLDKAQAALNNWLSLRAGAVEILQMNTTSSAAAWVEPSMGLERFQSFCAIIILYKETKT